MVAYQQANRFQYRLFALWILARIASHERPHPQQVYVQPPTLANQ